MAEDQKLEIAGTEETVQTPIGELSIHYFEIQGEMVHSELDRNAADLVLFTGYEAAARKMVAETHQAITQRQSELWRSYRQRKDAGEKWTKEDISHEVELDEHLIHLKSQLTELKFQLDRLAGIVKAFERKGFLIQSKSALMRKELDIQMQREREENAERYMLRKSQGESKTND